MNYNETIKLDESSVDVELVTSSVDVELVELSDSSENDGYKLNEKKEVIYLKISDEKLENIPTGILKLSELKVLELSHCKLNNLKGISNLKKLEKLYLDYNSIKNIEELSHLKNLSSVSLNSNELKSIHPLTLLGNLRILSVSRNRITTTKGLNKLKKLVFLNIAQNKIKSVKFLKGLGNLEYLNLDSNNVSSLEYVKDLKKIDCLRLSNTNIVDFEILKSFPNLADLTLNKLGLKNISFLEGLISLTNLDLSDNGISNLKVLGSLQNLQELQILDNEIKSLEPLGCLNKLTYLNLSHNQVSQIEPIAKLKNLKVLWLLGNPVKDYNLISNFKKLTDLSLGGCEVTKLNFLNKLGKLTRLDIQQNSIKSILPIKYLKNLSNLNLSNNDISDISYLKGLKKLKTLQLQVNPIVEIPSWLTDFNMEIRWYEYGYEDGFITLYDNPISTPPIQIVKKGKESIKRYYSKIGIEGSDNIYEAKLVLVGEGSSGKTSLQKRLLKKNSALPKKETRTRGIDIVDWVFKREKKNKHIAHIWDFGGQDVYYPVHRFFITENSIFVLLASTRQTHHNFDYWIPTIYQFGGKSPIILGQTCHDGNSVSWNDVGSYIGNSNFNIIKTKNEPYYKLNLPNSNEGLAEIKKIIIDQLTGLPHYGKGVPGSWIPVRDLIDKVSKDEACISFEKFKEICQNSNKASFSSIEDVTDCCQFFHDIGVVLWYSSEQELKDWVILQPEWAMGAVYRIIDDSEIQKRQGNIISNDFDRLWNCDSYVDKQIILKKMLEIFKIAFPKKHKRENYIIPARLNSMPVEKRWKKSDPLINLEYHYDFMPRGIVNQISADLSRYIVEGKEVWNNAVNLTLDESKVYCQIEEDFYNRKLLIKAKGFDSRGIVILVMDALKNITDGYKGVKPEIIVPCICSDCKKSSNPTVFQYDKLLKWFDRRESAEIICNESGDSFLVESLLYNYGLKYKMKLVESVKVETKKVENKTIKLFLASSSELKKDREQFEIFINRENKILNEKGIFIRLEIWEDFIDSMSRTRLQDEYNKVIEGCDIFVSLFFTKVGKYTLEEFETAFGNFMKSGKPKIYTYFKNGNVDVNSITSEDIQSKEGFKNRLKNLEHFYTSYDGIDDLKLQFKNQLVKIID